MIPELKAFWVMDLYAWVLLGKDYWAQGLIEGEFPIVTETFPRNRFLVIL